MKICIAGKNNIAVEICKLAMQYFRRDNIFIVTNKTDNGRDGFQRSFLKFAKIEQLNVVDLETIYSFEDLIFLSLEFDRLINPAKFKSVRLYNIHFSLLPKYKGMYTSYWPIANNEKVSGVTLHKIDHGIDTGDIIDQIEISITSQMNARQLYLEYIKTGITLIRSNFEHLLMDNITSRSQSAYQSTYYSKLSVDYKNVVIDLNQTAHTISTQIRAFNFRDFQLPKVVGISISHCVIDKIKSTEKSGYILENNEWCLYCATVDYNIYLYKDRLIDLLKCCFEGNLELLKYFIRNKYSLNEQDDEGITPIIAACKNGQIEILKLLALNGADFTLTDYSGKDPLSYATSFDRNNNECKKFILEKIAKGDVL